MNRTLLERARCILSNAELKVFWQKRSIQPVILISRCPSISIGCKTSEEVWSAMPASYAHLRIFGCPTCFHVNDGKLEPRAKKTTFFVYGNGAKGYRLWCTD